LSTESVARPVEPAASTPTGHLVRPIGGGLRSLWESAFIAERRYFKVAIGSQLLAPVLYLLSLGVGLGSVVNAGNGAHELGVGYLSYIAPALIAATALQVAVSDATYPILHGGFKHQRVYFAMNATPLTSAQISQSVLGWIAAKAAVSATVYLAVVACFGGIRSIGALLCIPIAALGAMALAAPIAAYSATVQDEGAGFATIFRFIVMPMFLFSGTFYPISTLPHWARLLAWISPLWHASELSRWVALGPLHLASGVGHVSPAAALAHLLYLAALTTVGVVVTGQRFRVRLER
jgi:lipooligosaccharide transport system permease protein